MEEHHDRVSPSDSSCSPAAPSSAKCLLEKGTTSWLEYRRTGETTVGNLAVDFICESPRVIGKECLADYRAWNCSRETGIKKSTPMQWNQSFWAIWTVQAPTTPQPDDPEMPLQTHLQCSSSQNKEEIGDLIRDQPKQNKPKTWLPLPKSAFTSQESWPCSCLTCPSFAHIRWVYKWTY